jgi:acyl carrier protein
LSFLADLAGVPAEQMAELLNGADSLDLVELIVEIEENFGSNSK